MRHRTRIIRVGTQAVLVVLDRRNREIKRSFPGPLEIIVDCRRNYERYGAFRKS